jgi:hypothetical protein
MRGRSALELEIYLESGRQMLFVCRRLNWSLTFSIVRSLWGCNHVDWCCLDSRGASGGILIM